MSEIDFSVAAHLGSSITICGRKYLLSIPDVCFANNRGPVFKILVLQMIYDAAAAFCCSFGLQIIRIKSVWEEKCLAEYFSVSAYCHFLLVFFFHFFLRLLELAFIFFADYASLMFSWVYASKWATPDGRSIWCNTGEYFCTNISLNPPPYGNTNPFAHIYAVSMGNNGMGNLKTFGYLNYNPTSGFRFLCEEP
jgi:hypothetical protein